MIEEISVDEAWKAYWPGLPSPEREYRFHSSRKWRLDYAWPAEKVAVEVEGGVWTGGRHTRGAGFLKDCEKYNQAAAMGWRVFRFTPRQVESGEAAAFMQEILT